MKVRVITIETVETVEDAMLVIRELIQRIEFLQELNELKDKQMEDLRVRSRRATFKAVERGFDLVFPWEMDEGKKLRPELE